jgi:hypothetical protein
MVFFTTALLALTAAMGIIAAPVEGPIDTTVSKRSSPNAQGTNNGFFYQFCTRRSSKCYEDFTKRFTGTDGAGGTATYANKAAGEYSVTWQGISDFTSGKGWRAATPRNITFKGNVNAQGNFYLAVYTWSQKGENYVSTIPCPHISPHTCTIPGLQPDRYIIDSRKLRLLQPLRQPKSRHDHQRWKQLSNLQRQPRKQLHPELVNSTEQAL